MTDSGKPLEADPPPKKRSFFKKAAWQTKPKSDSERDLFSHSSEFQHIVAEDARRKQEARQKKEEEKKQKVEEEKARKRRRISREDEDVKASGRPSNSRASDRKEQEDRATPMSPDSPVSLANSDKVRESPRKARGPASPVRSEPRVVIDLGDSDDDVQKPQYQTSNMIIAELPSKPAPSDDLEEIEDPEVAKMRARIQARTDAAKDVVVEVLITTEIPDANPLKIKIKTSATMEKLRLAWCAKQDYSEDMTRRIFLTWKGNKVFDSTTVKRLGINVDEAGIITVEGTSDLYDEDNTPRIHLEAWTEEVQKQWKAEEARLAEVVRVAAERATAPAVDSPPDLPKPPEDKVRLFLKVKGKPDWKVCVNPHTTIAHLTSAYKTANKVPEDQPITLIFDGDRLCPMDTIADSDIEDMTAVDVYFK